MVLLARALARVLAFVLLVALAVARLAVAVFSIQGGTSTLSLPHLAEILRLSSLRDTVSTFLGSLEAPGPVATVALLSGIGVAVIGLLLMAGLLAPRRERLVTLSHETAFICGGHSFTAHPVRGYVDGKTWLGLEVNAWSSLLFVAAGLLLVFGAPLHWAANSMSPIVGLVLGAASVIALYDRQDVFGIFAANGLTKLVWGAAGGLLILLSLLPRVRVRTRTTMSPRLVVRRQRSPATTASSSASPTTRTPAVAGRRGGGGRALPPRGRRPRAALRRSAKARRASSDVGPQF